MSIVRTALAAALLSLAVSASADLTSVPSGKYALDETHGYITFSYNHLGFSNPHVGFDSFDVDLTLDNEDIENSMVNVLIDATSINSRVETFNGHLNGENFFDTENYPTITFKSTGIEMTGKNTMNVTGDLTIKGITKPVTLEAMINKAADHPMRKVPTIGVSAQTTVSRSDWGLTRAVPNVGDEVTIWLEVELLQNNDG
jgi:polyisoprenoid-binding protein YceI